MKKAKMKLVRFSEENVIATSGAPQNTNLKFTISGGSDPGDENLWLKNLMSFNGTAWKKVNGQKSDFNLLIDGTDKVNGWTQLQNFSDSNLSDGIYDGLSRDTVLYTSTGADKVTLGELIDYEKNNEVGSAHAKFDGLYQWKQITVGEETIEGFIMQSN